MKCLACVWPRRCVGFQKCRNFRNTEGKVLAWLWAHRELRFKTCRDFRNTELNKNGWAPKTKPFNGETRSVLFKKLHSLSLYASCGRCEDALKHHLHFCAVVGSSERHMFSKQAPPHLAQRQEISMMCEKPPSPLQKFPTLLQPSLETSTLTYRQHFKLDTIKLCKPLHSNLCFVFQHERTRTELLRTSHSK